MPRCGRRPAAGGPSRRGRGPAPKARPQARPEARPQTRPNAYARLPTPCPEQSPKVPSRERTIKTIQTKQTRSGGQFSETIKPRKDGMQGETTCYYWLTPVKFHPTLLSGGPVAVALR